MKPPRVASLLILFGILRVLGPRPAFAADRPCSPVAIEVDGSVRDRWPDLPENVRQAFEARDDIDACARVKLTLDVSIIVEVDLPDGRVASRSVSRPEDVVPTLQALLLVPQQQKTSQQGSSSSSPETAVAVAPVSTPAPRPATSVNPALGSNASTRLPSAKSSRLQVELSVFAGARIGGDQASLGLGALSFLEIAGWLAGFEGRADRYQRISGSPFAGAVELGALGGRRFRLGTLALDLVAGPALAIQGTATSTIQSAPSSNPVTESSSSTVARLLFNARLNFRARSTFRTFIGINTDFGPSRAPSADLPGNAPRLPVWVVGLDLGATLGTQ